MSKIVVTVKLPKGVDADDVKVTVDPMPAEESSASVDETSRCPSCGYTEADKRLHLDHHLCPQNKKSRARRLSTTRYA